MSDNIVTVRIKLPEGTEITTANQILEITELHHFGDDFFRVKVEFPIRRIPNPVFPPSLLLTKCAGIYGSNGSWWACDSKNSVGTNLGWKYTLPEVLHPDLPDHKNFPHGYWIDNPNYKEPE